MKSNDKLMKLVIAALLAALTCVVTMLLPIAIPNTKNGYINPGDAIVLLSGVILGPLYGGLAAGIGSFFADLFLGSIVYAPATLVIKAVAAVAAAYSYHRIRKGSVILAGVSVGIVVTVGYYLYECIIYTSMIVPLASIPFNLLQNVMGIIIASLLVPLIKKVPQIRIMIDKQSK